MVVPLEAALSASRRVVAIASTFALAAAGLLVLAGELDLLPPPAPSGNAALAALGIVSAALYATGLALGAEALARTSFWLLYAEEDRYRLLARNMTDVITATAAMAPCCSCRRRRSRCSAAVSSTCTGKACSAASMSPTAPLI